MLNLKESAAIAEAIDVHARDYAESVMDALTTIAVEYEGSADMMEGAEDKYGRDPGYTDQEVACRWCADRLWRIIHQVSFAKTYAEIVELEREAEFVRIRLNDSVSRIPELADLHRAH